MRKNFHCKGREGREKLILAPLSNGEYVKVVRYNRDKTTGEKMISLHFINCSRLYKDKNYIKFFVDNDRIYFEFTDTKDIHTYKLTKLGRKLTDRDVSEKDMNRKIQTSTEPKLIPFVGKDYKIFYDTLESLYFIERSNKTKLF